MRWKGLLAGFAPLAWWLVAKYGYILTGSGIEATRELPGLTEQGATPADLLFVLAIVFEIALAIGAVWAVIRVLRRPVIEEDLAVAIPMWFATLGGIMINAGWYISNCLRINDPSFSDFWFGEAANSGQLVSGLGWVMLGVGILLAVTASVNLFHKERRRRFLACL